MQAGVLPSADRHYLEMQKLELDAVALMLRAWQGIDLDHVVESWDAATARVLLAIANLQREAAAAGAGYAGEVLRDQNITSIPEARVEPDSLVGWASDGRPLESLLRAPLDVVAGRLDDGLSFEDAMDAGRASAQRIAHTQIGDAGRIATGMDVATRPTIGWVRMLSGTSCSRCVVLAGQFYRWSDGFDRHPQDDCVHVPTSTDRARERGLLDDPKAYFRSLSREEQDKRFGKAGAQAIRDGADIGQVVNARRGMATAADTGLLVTTEGTTRRGFAGSRMIRQGAATVTYQAETVRRISRNGVVERTVRRDRVQTHRLMPEAIYKIAADRAEALVLLKRFGYVV